MPATALFIMQLKRRGEGGGWSGGGGTLTHRALVWLFPGVSSHVDQKHVLCLERLLQPHAALPVAHKVLLAVSVDVVGVDVLYECVQMLALYLALLPLALVVVWLFHARVAVVHSFLPLRVTPILNDPELRLKHALVAVQHRGVVRGVRVHQLLLLGHKHAPGFLLHCLQSRTHGDEWRRGQKRVIVYSGLHFDVAAVEECVFHFHIRQHFCLHRRAMADVHFFLHMGFQLTAGVSTAGGVNDRIIAISQGHLHGACVATMWLLMHVIEQSQGGAMSERSRRAPTGVCDVVDERTWRGADETVQVERAGGEGGDGECSLSGQPVHGLRAETPRSGWCRKFISLQRKPRRHELGGEGCRCSCLAGEIHAA